MKAGCRGCFGCGGGGAGVGGSLCVGSGVVGVLLAVVERAGGVVGSGAAAAAGPGAMGSDSESEPPLLLPLLICHMATSLGPTGTDMHIKTTTIE